MTFRVEVVCLHDGGEQRCSVMEMERAELALETLGMSVAEGKAIETPARLFGLRAALSQ